jgi:hypothetical protein
MPELLQTLKAKHDAEVADKKFFASLEGIKLDETEQQEGPTFEDVQRKALGIHARGDDIVSLQGQFAQEAGFGIGMGLGYIRE